MPNPDKSDPGDLAKLVAALPWGKEESAGPPVRVEMKGDRSIHVEMHITPTGIDSKTTGALLGDILPPDAVKELLGKEKELFAWLAQDASHPTRFAMDPLACLPEAGIKLDQRAVERLRRHREMQKRVLDPASLRTLKSLKIAVQKKLP